MEFPPEFDLANQQIVLLNEIDIGSSHENSQIADFINSPVNVNSCDYKPFEEIEYPEYDLETANDCSTSNETPQHQLQIIKNQNGIRYMKFRKSKRNVKTKLVDQQQCPIAPCLAVFTSKLKLRKHIQEHAFKKKHRCDICFEEFNVLENLMLHTSLHSGDGRCPQCGKIFRRLASLEGHIKTHFKNEYYTCNQGCDEMFHVEWMLKQHINQFHPTESSKIQQEKEELAKERKQRRKNLLNCQYCGKQFAKNCLLIRHERIHNGQKPFNCDKCDRSFAQKNTLIIHQRRHSDQRQYQCDQCPQTFIQKGNLVSHTAKCHTHREGESSFPCNQCACTFKKIGTLNAHISKFHASQGVCVDDDLGFKVDDVMQQLNDLHRSNSLGSELISKEMFFNLPASPPSVEGEIRNANPDQSDYANATATTQSSLKLAVHTSNGIVTHRNVMQRIHGNVRWYVCLYCPKEFRRPSDLVRHIRIHTKEKPFSCPVTNCTKKFSVKSSLNTHINTHLKTSQQQTCRVCLQTFHSAESFDEHCWLTHQDNPMFQCFICSHLCVTNGELKRHLKCHRSPVKQKKPVPQKEIDDGIQLDIIMKEPIMLTNDGQIEVTTEKSAPDQERKFECNVCHSLYKRNGHLKEHMLSHLGVKLHKCNICFKSFGKMSILNRHLLYHNEKKFKCEICNASFISNNQLNRHKLKHTTQRNVMCPYCQKRFKSKATCRIHLQIHKTEWVKQFKEQLRSGTIQFEEDTTNDPMNDNPGLDVMSDNDGIGMETLNESTSDSYNAMVQNTPQDSQQEVLFTDLVQEAQVDDSGNQFEYFLLLPTNSEPNGLGVGDEQFIVNDEQLNFSNLQFIQLEQSALLEMEDSQSMNFRLNDNPGLEEQSSLSVDSHNIADCGSDMSQHELIPGRTGETSANNETELSGSNQIALTNKKTTPTARARRSTKSINKCETCSKIFTKPIDLRRHIRTHTLEKPFNCSSCPKAFSLNSTLQNHIKHKHSNDKQKYPCSVCAKSFSSRHAVITHTLIHSNSRPFKCDFCTTSFRTRGHLKIHQQIHLREGKKLGVSPSEIKTKKEKAKLLPLLNVMKEFSDQNVYQETLVDNNGFDEEYPETVRVERSSSFAISLDTE